MAYPLFLKRFEENASMAASGWALSGKYAAGAVDSCRLRAEDMLVKGACRTAPG